MILFVVTNGMNNESDSETMACTSGSWCCNDGNGTTSTRSYIFGLARFCNHSSQRVRVAWGEKMMVFKYRHSFVTFGHYHYCVTRSRLSMQVGFGVGTV